MEPAPTLLVTGSSGFIGERFMAQVPKTWGALGVDIVAGKYTSLQTPNYLLGLRQVVHHPLVVLHLACVRMGACAAQVRNAYMTNLVGVVHLLEEFPYAHHVLASTSSLYFGGTNLREDCEVFTPTVYARSKRAAEDAVLAAGGTILRLGNVYGERDETRPDTDIITRLMRAAFCAEAVHMYRNGTDVRDFVYVDDVTDAMRKALSQQHKGVYNIATGVGTSVWTLAADIAVAVGRTLPVTATDSSRPIDTTQIKVLNCDRASTVLGWEAKTSLRKGLGYVAEFFAQRYPSSIV